MKKIFSGLILLCICLSLLPCSPVEAGFSMMSDEAFFGVWNSASGVWSETYPGKLDYKGNLTWEESGKEHWSTEEKTLWLSVENHAKAGNYASAKADLQQYYIIRTNNSFKDTYTTSTVRNSAAACELHLAGFKWNNTALAAQSDFTTTAQTVSFNLGGGNVTANGSYTFILASYNLDGARVTINSRDSTTGEPTLVVTANGKEHRFTAVKDTYIKPNVNMKINYGTAQSLLISEGKNTTTSLFNDSTERTYLQFNVR